METLKFLKGNAKLGKHILTFSLISGHTCPFAKDCLAKVDRETKKLTDGPDAQFRCFSASAEVQYDVVRNARFHNFDLIKACKTKEEMAALIVKSLPEKATIVRIHVAGDFFNQMYFDAWMLVATMKPEVLFYAYTKSLPYWVARLGQIPTNLKLTASKGGRMDNLIEKHNLKYAEVVFTEDEAKAKGFVIDHDDSNAYNSDKSFALLIHGTQKAGSVASTALNLLRKAGNGGYSRKKKETKELIAA